MTTTQGQELTARLMEHSLAQTHAATNAVIRSLEIDLAELRRDFVTFYDEVDKAAEVVTTRRLERSLSKWSLTADFANERLKESDN